MARDDQGRPYTVRYEAVNAMLLNEFLKDHGKIEEQGRRGQQQEATIAELKSTVAKQAATIARQQERSQATAAEQQQEIKALTISLKEQSSRIYHVSVQLEASRPAPQMVLNDQ